MKDNEGIVVKLGHNHSGALEKAEYRMKSVRDIISGKIFTFIRSEVFCTGSDSEGKSPDPGSKIVELGTSLLVSKYIKPFGVGSLIIPLL